MSKKNFTVTLLSSQTPEDVFNVILSVRKWWSGYYSEKFTGKAAALNDEFTFRAGDGAHYSKQKLVELVRGKRIVWLITESKLSFLEKTDEWDGTKLVFEISRKGSKTQVKFTHQGLTTAIECYDSCAPAWKQYLQNKLLPLISA